MDRHPEALGAAVPSAADGALGRDTAGRYVVVPLDVLTELTPFASHWLGRRDTRIHILECKGQQSHRCCSGANDARTGYQQTAGDFILRGVHVLPPDADRIPSV